ncbi:Tetratricopeptide repeat-containing protein [Desulfacinum infernum DSM 9756]|uniref:Tetratricopeptide repeat-containing protein n=1 Tax=Desulfacinum infernum DSM 9756 TaxID=1121391 RepID=A0A1M5H9P0_9BACT|nr:tetratricopeptide repeat protein [Desulfacinum infernum]SHG12709.1 Tetratricopeptide repeat-containing protein [Desulfacinum infernum DSM 9756]
MGLLDYPKQLYYEYGSRLAIFLINRRLRKKGLDPGAWLVLARLYEVRKDWPRAVQTLDRALKIYPGNAALEAHRSRIRDLARQAGSGPA